MEGEKISAASYDKLYDKIIINDYLHGDDLYYISSEGYIKTLNEKTVESYTLDDFYNVLKDMGRLPENIMEDTKKRHDAGQQKSLRFVNDIAVNEIYETMLSLINEKHEKEIIQKNDEIKVLNEKISKLESQISKLLAHEMPHKFTETPDDTVYLTESIRESVPQEESDIIGGDHNFKNNFTFKESNNVKLSTFEVPSSESDMIFRI